MSYAYIYIHIQVIFHSLGPILGTCPGGRVLPAVQRPNCGADTAPGAEPLIGVMNKAPNG